MPPSASPTRRPGNLWNSGEKSRSAAHTIEFVPIVEIQTTIGASGAVSGGLPELPKCMNNGNWVSCTVANSGSQWSLWIEGRPSGLVASGKVIAFAPFPAQRSTSTAASAGSHRGMMIIGIRRSGSVPAHSSMMKSL